MIPSDADENAPPVHLAEDRTPQRHVGDRVPQRRRLRTAAGPQPWNERTAIDDAFDRSAAAGDDARQEAVDADGQEISRQRIASEGGQRMGPAAPSTRIDEPVTQRQ